MPRMKNVAWNPPENADGTKPLDSVKVALLMDLRDELQAIRSALLPLRHLDCGNFLAIPTKLDTIARNTRKPKRKRASKAQR